MNTTEAIDAAELNDAALVAKSLDGNRDAFCQIVEKYQNLISSLAYCATGNLSQSEDLAQETFVSAWRQLAQLREPAKLRPWLCSITRFLISKAFRRQSREPDHAAASLEAVEEWVSPEPLPPEQLIGEEEKAILWRSLERIPEIYREPLVLFYREQQSIETVAHDLELSEDAVKQRLSRGRKMLQEQFLAFVAGALKQTATGKTFTIGVMAALPLLATTAKAATAGATATKGSGVAKMMGLTGFLQTILKVIAPIGVFVSLGSWLGYAMGRDAEGESQRQRDSVARFWGMMAVSLFVFVLLPILLWAPLGRFFGSRENLLQAVRGWLDVLYAVIVVALVWWA
jgi:RNA polymerase sigma factor (sigma-70 family)